MADGRSKAATRPIGNARIQPDGSIVAESILSPESFVVGAEVWIPPRKVIPIVFLPGIMGSNLKVKPGSENLVRRRMGVPKGSEIPAPWRPPNSAPAGILEGWHQSGCDPRTRQALLSGDTTVVDDAGFLDAHVEGMPLSNLTSRNDEEARFRGWGTVHWDSYGEFLLYLEKELRNLQDSRIFMNASPPIASIDDPPLRACAEWWPLLHAGDPKKSTDPAAFKVTKDDLKKLSKYWFPVYANGYNWLNSNAESGQQVLANIEKIIKVYTGLKGPSGKQLFECEKVILVTHSMGGLVGRWAAKHDDRKRILGVIHSVQPAIGSPLSYRRVVAGTEVETTSDQVFAQIAGPDQKATTPVFCLNAGCLQLLPNKRYPKGWLKLEIEENGRQPVNFLPAAVTGGQMYDTVTVPRTMASLPREDPYQEIYRQQDAWWRLADPELLDPAGRFTRKDDNAWKIGFLKPLGKAEDFHNNLGDYYHPNTYATYGNDPDHSSFGTVRWRVARTSLCVSNYEILGGRPVSNDEATTLMENSRHRLTMSGKDYAKQRFPLFPSYLEPTDFIDKALLKGKRLIRVHPNVKIDLTAGGTAPLNTGLEENRDGRPLDPEYLAAAIQPQDAPGDGTVPWQSGEAPGKGSAKGRTFAINGYAHASACKHDGVRRFVLSSVAQLIRGLTG